MSLVYVGPARLNFQLQSYMYTVFAFLKICGTLSVKLSPTFIFNFNFDASIQLNK
jgi:hypothetical protein